MKLVLIGLVVALGLLLYDLFRTTTRQPPAPPPPPPGPVIPDFTDDDPNDPRNRDDADV